MPFTLSHAVIAPPISKLLRLPLAPLVIGTMTPDLTRVLSSNQKWIGFAHTWSGIINPDLLIGFGFCFLWYVIYRPLLYHFLSIHDPLHLTSFYLWIKFILLSTIAIILGSATHIIWDGLTHLDFRTFAFHHILAQPVSFLHYTYPLHFVLQIGCSILALPFLVYFMYRYVRKRRVESNYQTFDMVSLFVLITIPNTLAIYNFYHYYLSYKKLIPINLYYFIGRGINVYGTTCLIYLTLLGLIFLIIQHLKKE